MRCRVRVVWVVGLALLATCGKDSPRTRIERPAVRPWIEGQPGRRAVGGRVTAESGFAPLADELKPTVVNLQTRLPGTSPRGADERGAAGESPAQAGSSKQVMGSGAIISPEGHILTNLHVVDGAEDIRVRLLDGTVFDGTLVGGDDRYDLALIKVQTDHPLPTVTLGDSDALRVGQWLIVIGNPFGLQHSVTVGIVSAKDRQIGNGPYDDFIQTDASINPGNSGGPIFDVMGQMVAVARSTRHGAQGIGFAVPANTAKRFVEEVLTRGTIRRGWLGVSSQDLTAALAKELGIREEPGVLVAQVVAGSPADVAGLRRGDLIRSVAGRPVAGRSEFLRVMGMTRAGDEVGVVVTRGGKDLSVEAVMVERPTQAVAAEAPGPAVALGCILSERNVVEAGGGARAGLLVVHVEPEEAAADAGLQEGDVIVEVNREPVATLADWARFLDGLASGGNLLLLVERPTGDQYLTLRKP